MNITVFPTWQAVNPRDLLSNVAVVIDVLRATNTIISALANGALEIIPVPEIEEAWRTKGKYPDYLLGGERNSQKIEGFDLGNSPLEYSRDQVLDKGIILSTSNGSRALNISVTADATCIASFINSQAIADFLFSTGKDISIICAGTSGTPSLEDSLAAGKIIKDLLKTQMFSLNDYGQLCLGAYEHCKSNIIETIGHSRNGQKLKLLRMDEDINYCSLVDQSTITPKLYHGKIIL